MTTRGRALMNGDPAQINPDEEPRKARLSQPHSSFRHDPSSHCAFPALDAPRRIDASTRARIGDVDRFPVVAVRVPWSTFWHEFGTRHGIQQMRQTKPTAIWISSIDYRDDRRRSRSFGGKRANEANGNLDKLCRLSEQSSGRPLVRRKTTNEANGNLGELCRLSDWSFVLPVTRADRANEASGNLDKG